MAITIMIAVMAPGTFKIGDTELCAVSLNPTLDVPPPTICGKPISRGATPKRW